MIVTLATAGLCGLVFFWLSLRVVQVRQSARVEIGDGGDIGLLARIRAHANFAEYVPICLVLMGVIEASYDSTPWLLAIVGAVLVAARVAHALGMSIRGPNTARIAGVGATWTIMAGLSLWAIFMAATLPTGGV